MSGLVLPFLEDGFPLACFDVEDYNLPFPRANREEERLGRGGRNYTGRGGGRVATIGGGGSRGGGEKENPPAGSEKAKNTQILY